MTTSRLSARLRALALALGLAGFGLLTSMAAPLPAHAQAAPGAIPAADGRARSFPQLLSDWNQRLDRVETALGRRDLADGPLGNLQGEIEAVIGLAETSGAVARGQSNDLRRLVDALGPPPDEGQPPEAQDLARQRQRLMAELTIHDGEARQCDLVVGRADALLRTVAEMERGRMAATLLLRESAPFSPRLWYRGGVDLMGAAASIAVGPANWLASPEISGAPATAWYSLLAAVLAAGTLAWPLRLLLIRRFGRTVGAAQEPTYSRRILASAAEGIARGILPVFGVGAVYGALDAFDLLSGPFGDALGGLAAAGCIFFPMVGLARASLSPDRPEWRVVPLVDGSCRRLFRLLVILAAVTAASTALAMAGRNLQLAPPVVNVCVLVSNTVTAIVIALISAARNWRRARSAPVLDDCGQPVPPVRRPLRSWGPTVRLGVRVAVAMAIIFALSGFYNLSSFIIRNLLNISLAAAAYYILSTAVREGVARILHDRSGALVAIRHALGISDDAGRRANFWLSALLDLMLAAVLLLLLLPSLGVPTRAIFSGLKAAFDGFKVGGLTISISDIAFAILLYLLVMSATRFAQRALEERILPQTRFDAGVQNSIKAATGYVGIVIASMIAISAMGLDLSNLALIAGAFSVGIGFGLQNIVNNFVSGLILLAERPIKVGDWVEIGPHVGNVRHINVRSTEIETAQRASVIIPNSDLLSNALTNRTHKSSMGRMEIKLGVAYGCDTDAVRQALLDVAAAEPRVLTEPAPYVLFRAFGDSTLDFELRVFVPDIEIGIWIRSDLNFAIDRVFRERNLEIPFGQTDIHLRDFDRIEALVQRVMQGQRMTQGSPGASEPPKEDKA